MDVERITWKHMHGGVYVDGTEITETNFDGHKVFTGNAIERLSELEDKEEPKQVRHVDDYTSFCPNCEDVRVNSSMPYCWRCGQRLKW